jgi:RND family efflux transporter MFP subunit
MESAMIKKYSLTGMLFTISLFAITGETTNRPHSGEQNAVNVQCAPVLLNEAKQELSFTAPLKATHRTALGFSIAERLQSRPVHIGDRVTKGQLLATCENESYANSVLAVQAEASRLRIARTKAEQDFTRVSHLFDSKAATREECEAVQAYRNSTIAAVQAIEAREKEAVHLLEECKLKAPFEATVADVFMQPGEFTIPGKPVVMLTGKGLELEIRVPENLLSHFQKKSPVAISFPLVDIPPVQGTILRVGLAGYASNKLFPILISIPDTQGLHPGMTAVAHLELVRNEGFLVPLSAVTNPGGRQPVILEVRNGKIAYVPITIIRITQDKICIQAELQPDSRVVISSQSGLLDGDLVEEIR